MSIIRATPAARKLAQTRSIDLSRVTGTGNGSYIRLSDVPVSGGTLKTTHLAGKIMDYYKIDRESIVDSHIAVINKKAVQEQLSNRASKIEEGKVNKKIALAGIRKTIAQRMSQSLDIAPQYTLFSEVDATRIKAMLKELNSIEKDISGNKLTVTDIMVKIIADALKKNPLINTSIIGDEIVFHEHVNIGIAVALEGGLIVPNIKNADQKSIREICAERRLLAGKAREGRLTHEEYTGGTFTISNLGMYPIDFSTPIINQPESGIIGLGRISEKLAAIDGKIEIRSFMGISLTLDHRHIDGAEGAKFIAALSGMAENPLGTCVRW